MIEQLARQLATQLTPTSVAPTLTRRQGVISAVNAGPPASVDVTVGGIVIPAVRYLSSYAPTAADVVWVDFNGADPLVIGATTPGAWTTFTPSIAADTTNPNLGAGGTLLGRYTRNARTIIGTFIISMGTSGFNAGVGSWRFMLPVTARTSDNDHTIIGQGYIFHPAGGANTFNTVQLAIPSGQNGWAYVLLQQPTGVPTFVASAAPWAWAASDWFVGQFSYEAAS